MREYGGSSIGREDPQRKLPGRHDVNRRRQTGLLKQVGENMSQPTPINLLRLTAIALIVLALVAGRHTAYAQDSTAAPSPSPESEELKRLRERNAILEEQKKIAVNEKEIEAAKKEKLETQFPKPSTTPLEGKTEVDSGVKIESEMAAYASMAKAADIIAKELKTRNVDIKFLAIYNDRDIKTLLGYRVINSQIDMIALEYDRQFVGELMALSSGVSGPRSFTITPVTTIAASVLGSFIDLIALFRTDTSVKGLPFNVAESAFVSEIFRALKRDDPNGYGDDINLYYPAIFPPNLNVEQPYVILTKIQALYLVKDRAEKLVTRIVETEKVLGETVAEIAALKKAVQQVNNDLPLLDKELERLQKLYWRWPSSRLAERIEETHGRIQKLKDDRVKATAAIAAKTELKGSLEQKLEELYSELEPEVETIVTDEVVQAAINRTLEKIQEAEAVLGRSFRTGERAALLRGFAEDEKKRLVDEVEKRTKVKLPEDQKKVLLDPLSDAERSALSQIDQGMELTSAQKLALAPDEEKAAVRRLREKAVATLKALNVQFEKLVAELIKVDEAVGVSALTSYIQAENLKRAMGCEIPTCETEDFANSYWMQLRVVSAGGNNKIKRNLITNIFTGDNISHSGGSIVEYILYDVNRKARYSNTISVYEDYRKAKDIKSLAQQNQ
jgi:hypothetical protein